MSPVCENIGGFPRRHTQLHAAERLLYIVAAIKQTARRGVRLTTDDVLDAGRGGSDGDGDRRGVKMLSDSQVYVLNAGESVVLECYFNAAKYNMFDYPLLWKKVFSTSLLSFD